MLPGPSFAALAAHRRFLRTPTNTHTHLHAYVYVCMYLQYVVLATGFWSIILVSSGLQSAADKEWTHGAGAGAERGQASSGRHLLLPATSCSRLQLATAKVEAAAASANRKLYGAIAPKGSELVIFTFIAKLCIFFLHDVRDTCIHTYIIHTDKYLIGITCTLHMRYMIAELRKENKILAYYRWHKYI